MRHSIAVSLLALLSSIGLFLPDTAHAYLLRVDFTVDVGQPQDWDGYFAFDHDVIPAGGGSVWSPALASLFFSYGGVTWDAGNAEVTYLGFDEDCSLRDWNVNNLGYYDPGYLGPQLDILGFMSGIGGEFQYWDGSVPILNYGEVASWTVTKIAEPGTIALLFLGVVPLLMIRRQEKAPLRRCSDGPRTRSEIP